MRMLRYAVFVLLTVLVPAVSFAANHYVRAGATGANNGMDWANAHTALPSTLVRGDVYYIADGSYGSQTFDDATSGSTYIYVKKATAASHGTNEGWDPSYGDGQAVFTSWTVGSDYWDFDGVVGKSADDLPDYVPYGFKIERNATGSNQRNITAGNGSNFRAHLRFAHIEATFTNTTTWYTGMHSIYVYANDVSFTRVWFHRAGCNAIHWYGNGITVDSSVLEKTGVAQYVMKWSSSEHSEIGAIRGSNGVLKNSLLRDWRSTGGWILMGPGTSNNWNIYGNVFTQTGYFRETATGNGMIGMDSSGAGSNNIKIYNNTFANVNHHADLGFQFGSYASNTAIHNNIIVNVANPSAAMRTTAQSIGHNFYYNSGNHSESNVQYGQSDPLVDPAKGNYRLAYETDGGDDAISSLFNTDPDGVLRGKNGVWSRGAYQYTTAGPVSSRPSPPRNLRAN
jgi:hypothetical protein